MEYINNGKSAAVYKASDSNSKLYALKIFYNDHIERFGHEIQERRIEQEISLRGQLIVGFSAIENLIYFRMRKGSAPATVSFFSDAYTSRRLSALSQINHLT